MTQAPVAIFAWRISNPADHEVKVGSLKGLYEWTLELTFLMRVSGTLVCTVNIPPPMIVFRRPLNMVL